jgi:divalent metal cation (Fe/Co/Zn/Cd) transporter
MKTVVTILAGILAVFFGVGAILPALAKVRDLGAMPGHFVWSYTLGVFLLSVVVTSAVFRASRKRAAPL